MNKKITMARFSVLCLFLIFILSGTSAWSAEPDQASGTLQEGLRVVRFKADNPPENIYVYRGDTVRLVVENSGAPFSIHIPEYKVTKEAESGKDLEITFKAKNIGVFPIFCNGPCEKGAGAKYGHVVVMQYEAEEKAQYSELTAEEAERFIREKKPLILDVRTPNEYHQGHIRGAVLIPVQQLQQRLWELEEFKNKDIFIYCRSGNRSTVASAILIRAGFKKIHNLRHGIIEWYKKGFEIIQ